MPDFAPSERFQDDPFWRLPAMTTLIRRVPNVYGRLHQLGLFRNEFSEQLHVDFEIERDTNVLIPVTARGTPSPRVGRSESKIRSIKGVRLAAGAHIDADSLLGRREPGTNGVEMNVLTETSKRLRKLAIGHFQTREFMYWGALKGKVYSADGTELYNSYDIFGEQQKTFDFRFGDTSDTVDAVSREADYYLEENLEGDTATGYHWICGKAFFEKLVTKKEIRDAYKFYAATHGADPNREGARRTYVHAGTTFEVHTGNASFRRPDGTLLSHKFVADDEAIGVPIGSSDIFLNYHFPSDWMSRGKEPFDDVDKFGSWLYAKAQPDKEDRGVDIDTQQNILPICTHPKVVVRAISSN